MAKKTVDEFIDKVTPGIQKAVEKSMAHQFTEFYDTANSDDGFPSRGQLDQQFSLLRDDLRDNHKIELQFNDYLAKRIDSIKDILQEISNKMDRKPDDFKHRDYKSDDGHNYLKDANKKLDTLVRAADHTKDEFANITSIHERQTDKLDIIANSMLSAKAFERAMRNVAHTNDRRKDKDDTYGAAADRRVNRWIKQLTKSFNESKFGRSINMMSVKFLTFIGKITLIGATIKAFTKRAAAFAKDLLNKAPYIYLLVGLIWAGMKQAWRALQPLVNTISESLSNISTKINLVLDKIKDPAKKVLDKTKSAAKTLASPYVYGYKLWSEFLGKKSESETPQQAVNRQLGVPQVPKSLSSRAAESIRTKFDATQPRSSLNLLKFMQNSQSVPVPTVQEPESQSSAPLLNFENEMSQGSESQPIVSDTTVPMAPQPGNVVVNQSNTTTVVTNNVNTRQQSVNYQYGSK